MTGKKEGNSNHRLIITFEDFVTRQQVLESQHVFHVAESGIDLSRRRCETNLKRFWSRGWSCIDWCEVEAFQIYVELELLPTRCCSFLVLHRLNQAKFAI